jgi:hypothetical protein
VHIEAGDQNELQDREDYQHRDQPRMKAGGIEDANLHQGEDNQDYGDKRIDLPSRMLMFVDGVIVVVIMRAVTVFDGVIAHAWLTVLIR